MAQKYRASRTVGARIHRLTGQLQAIETMVGKRRSCAEILYQISAIRSGLEQVATILFEIELSKVSARRKLTKKDIDSLSHAFSKTI